MKKRILSIVMVLALVLIAALVPAFRIDADAAFDVD